MKPYFAVVFSLIGLSFSPLSHAQEFSVKGLNIGDPIAQFQRSFNAVSCVPSKQEAARILEVDGAIPTDLRQLSDLKLQAFIEAYSSDIYCVAPESEGNTYLNKPVRYYGLFQKGRLVKLEISSEELTVSDFAAAIFYKSQERAPTEKELASSVERLTTSFPFGQSAVQIGNYDKNSVMMVFNPAFMNAVLKRVGVERGKVAGIDDS